MNKIEEIESVVKNSVAVMLYFSAPSCSVCHALKPKLFDAVMSNFKEFKIIEVDISIEQDVSAHFGIFAIPSLIVFLDSKEFFRKTRHMSVDEVVSQIKRPYEIMTS